MNAFRHCHVVCAIAKDEDYYIQEWAEYHLGIGFQHLFIYENQSARYIEDIFSTSSLRDKVTCIRWPTYPPDSSQIAAYRHFSDTYGKDVEWAAIIDIDEFINLKQDDTIGQFIDRFPGADGIGINWRIFGSSGHERYTDQPMTERFCSASNIVFEANKLRKSIYRMKSVNSIDIHTGIYREDAAVYSPNGCGIDADVIIPISESNYDVAQVNHYFVKSREEWQRKIERGYTDGTVRPVEVFDVYDRNEVKDDSILRHRR